MFEVHRIIAKQDCKKSCKPRKQFYHPKRVPETGSEIISESKKIMITGKVMQSVIILVLYTLLPTNVIANQGKT